MYLCKFAYFYCIKNSYTIKRRDAGTSLLTNLHTDIVPYVGIIQIRLFGSRVTPSSQPVYEHPVYYFLRFPPTYFTTPSAFCQDFACVLGLVSVHVDLFLAQFRINKLLSGIKAEIA